MTDLVTRLRECLLNPVSHDNITKVIEHNKEVGLIETGGEFSLEGALAFFPERYPQVTTVYRIGDYSMEICGGPHIKNTRELKHFKITKQESVAAGVKRIKATVE